METQNNLVKHKEVSYCKTDQTPQTAIAQAAQTDGGHCHW